MLMVDAAPDLVRCVVTPGRRASDSAMVVSGNFPMSSAEIDSTMASELRFTEMASSIPLRIPVTVTVLRADASCAYAPLVDMINTAQPAAMGASLNRELRAWGASTRWDGVFFINCFLVHVGLQFFERASKARPTFIESSAAAYLYQNKK